MWSLIVTISSCQILHVNPAHSIDLLSSSDGHLQVVSIYNVYWYVCVAGSSVETASCNHSDPSALGFADCLHTELQSL